MLGNIVRGAHLVLGPAGSGKTSSLVDRYVRLARDGEQGILFLVHGRRAARSLGDRILRELGSSTDQVRVLSWHAFAWQLVRTYHRSLGFAAEPGLLTGPDQFTLVRDMLRAPEEQAHWDAFRKHLALAGFVHELREFVLRAQDALESPDSLIERARMARRPDLQEAAGFFRRYLDALNSEGLVDHANVIALAVSLLQSDEQVAAAVRAETKHLIIDDYQDVTPAQRTLLRELFVDGGSVTAAANPDARVFGFRGTSPDAVADFKTFFPPVQETIFTEVLRGEPQREAWRFDHLTEEAAAVARECRKLHARDGIPWGRIAVIVRRYGAGSRALRRAFEQTAIPYVVVGENRPLAAEPALKPMLDLARASLRTAEREDLLPALLSSPAVGLDAYEARALRREARLRDVPLTILLGAPPEDLPEQVRARLIDLRATLDEVVERDEKEQRPDGVFWFLWQRLDYFRAMVARGDEAELDAVAAFARAIERFSDRREGKRFSDYLDALEGVEFGPEPWRMPEERRPDAVRLMTAHHAVGSEFDAVFLAGCVEGEFPDPRDKRAMMDIRDLLDRRTTRERQQLRLEEETRLFGVATSRARKRLVVTAARESSQRETHTPSPFLARLGIDWTEPPAADEPLSRDEAEAYWRKRAVDASLSESDRRAAVEQLAKLPGVDPRRWWYQREWTRNDTALMPEGWRTSYSRLSPYENCGLQYLYQVELGLDPDQTHNMLVGSWIHDIVDRCAKGDVEANEDALVAELEKLWSPTVFPSVAVEHRYRRECIEILKRWLNADGAIKPLETEVDFEFPIDGVTLRGTIDRVVRCGTKSVRLIDYKTGKSYKTEAEVAEDLQLATYYLAMRRDPKLERLGEPMRLELSFLGAPRRDSGFHRAMFDPRKDPAFEQRSEERLLTLIDGIRAEEFSPNPGADCRFCKFKSLCPVWPEGDEVPL